MAESATLVVACRRGDYIASHIARAVEDCDAQIFNLNVTSPQSADAAERLTVELRVDRTAIDSLARSLQRYGFEVIEASASGRTDDDTLRSRINELLHYLEI